VTRNIVLSGILFTESGVTQPSILLETYLRAITNRECTIWEEKFLRFNKTVKCESPSFQRTCDKACEPMYFLLRESPNGRRKRMKCPFATARTENVYVPRSSGAMHSDSAIRSNGNAAQKCGTFASLWTLCGRSGRPHGPRTGLSNSGTNASSSARHNLRVTRYTFSGPR
jgi:hypothetical protein